VSGHDEFDELVVGYALDALEPDDEQRLRTHLRGCAACTRALAEVRGLAAELAYDAPQLRPPDALRQSIREGIGAAAGDPPPLLGAGTPPPRGDGPDARGSLPPPPQGWDEAAPPWLPPTGRDEKQVRDPEQGPARPAREPEGAPADADDGGPGSPRRRSGLRGRPSSVRPPSRPGPGGPGRVATPGGHSAHRARRMRPTAARLLAAGASAIVLVVGVVWGVTASNRASDRGSALAERNAVLQLLTRPGSRAVTMPERNGASATVVVAGDTMYLVTAGLDANNAAKDTYVLWADTGSSKPLVGVDAFDVRDTNMSVVPVGKVSTTVASARSYAISHEQGRSVPARPRSVILGG
jgi:hypothetical protein